MHGWADVQHVRRYEELRSQAEWEDSKILRCERGWYNQRARPTHSHNSHLNRSAAKRVTIGAALNLVLSGSNASRRKSFRDAVIPVGWAVCTQDGSNDCLIHVMGRGCYLRLEAHAIVERNGTLRQHDHNAS
eukprot:6212107-Pleurochrysis_carterae.AAC.3